MLFGQFFGISYNICHVFINSICSLFYHFTFLKYLYYFTFVLLVFYHIVKSILFCRQKICLYVPYNIVYILTINILRCSFLLTVYKSDLLSTSNSFLICYNYLLFDIIQLEWCNAIISFCFDNKITMRKFLNMAFECLLLLQSIYFRDKISMLILFVDQICNLLNDAINLFFSNKQIKYLVHGIIKPFYLLFVLIITWHMLLSWHYLVVPITYTFVCICDASKMSQIFFHS
jgi:hypothetical protein